MKLGLNHGTPGVGSFLEHWSLLYTAWARVPMEVTSKTPSSPPKMTLLKVPEADLRESKLSDLEYEGMRAGTAKGGNQRIFGNVKTKNCPSQGNRSDQETWLGNVHRRQDHRRKIFTQATVSDKKAEKKNRRIVNKETNALVANRYSAAGSRTLIPSDTC